MKATAQNSHLANFRISDVLWNRIKRFHLAPGKDKESLSYLWARCERVLGGYVVLAPEDAPYFAFGSDCYLRQSSGNVQLRRDVLNGMLVEFAKSDYNCLINIHDHWFSDDAVFSGVDDADDRAFDVYLRERFEPMLKRQPDLGMPRPIYNLSWVLGQKSGSARFTNLHAPRRAPLVAGITVIAEKWQSLPLACNRHAKAVVREENARHSAFIPVATQAEMSRIHIAIAGCGGLGSIYAEALGRAGFRRFTLIDDDALDATNLNRWQGGAPEKIGRNKARLLKENLLAMFPEASVKAVARPLDHAISVAAIATADIVIGGLDNDSARFHLAHVSAHYQLPYFDAGVAIEAGPPVDFKGRYFAQIPGVTGCILCKPCKLVDQTAIAADYANPLVLAERRNAGYVVDRSQLPAPSAYALNMRTSAMLVTEVQNFILGWRPLATLAFESWHTGQMQRWDRLTVPETAQMSCVLCGIRTGTGSAMSLPRRNIHSFSPVPHPTTT